VWGLLRPRKFPYAVRGSQTHKFSFGLVSLSLSISPSICTCTYIYIYLGTLSIGFFDHPTQPSLASLPTQVPSDDLTHTHTQSGCGTPDNPRLDQLPLRSRVVVVLLLLSPPLLRPFDGRGPPLSISRIDSLSPPLHLCSLLCSPHRAAFSARPSL
jgi:hypothetical protein